MANELIARLSARWREDPDFRAQIEADPKAALAAGGINVTAEEAVVAVDTEDTVHLVFPPDPNTDLGDDELVGLAGGSSNDAWLDAGGRYSSTR